MRADICSKIREFVGYVYGENDLFFSCWIYYIFVACDWKQSQVVKFLSYLSSGAFIFKYKQKQVTHVCCHAIFF